MSRPAQLTGFDYRSGRTFTLERSVWQKTVDVEKARGGTAKRDPDGTVAIYNSKGLRCFEIYDDKRRVRP